MVRLCPLFALAFYRLVVNVVSMSGFICSLQYDITCKLPNDISLKLHRRRVKCCLYRRPLLLLFIFDIPLYIVNIVLRWDHIGNYVLYWFPL